MFNEKDLKSRPLRIVQIAPNYHSIPPAMYGATERIIYDLTQMLVKLGHEVYLFATIGSRTSAKLIIYPEENTNVAQFVLENLPKDVDIIHDHTPESFIGNLKIDIPVICSIHDCFRFNQTKYSVYVSSTARKILGKDQGYYVYNGINIEDYQYCEEKQDYMLFMGAWMPHKGVLHAIEICERTGQKLKMAGPLFDFEYFNNKLKTRIDNNPNVIPMGVVGGQLRQDLFKHAKCVLVPSVCEESFGLVLIEAMACGTPVLGLSNGAIPEVLSGFPELICNSVDEMEQKVRKGLFPHPSKLREYVKERFSIASMTNRYVDLYRDIIKWES